MESKHQDEVPEPSVGDVMRRDVISIHPDAPVSELVRLLVQHRITGVPVLDDGGALVGVVSLADVVRHQHQSNRGATDAYYHDFLMMEGLMKEYQPALPDMRVAAIMSRDVITAAPEESITAVAERLVQYKIHRLIIARDGVMVGLVSTIDLLTAFARHRRAVTAARPHLQRA